MDSLYFLWCFGLTSAEIVIVIVATLKSLPIYLVNLKCGITFVRSSQDITDA